MEDKELLAAYDEITKLYGPQKKTFDEFKFQMESEEYRKSVFEKVGNSSKDVFGYDNFNQFNADKFLPAPELQINDIPTKADNLPRFNASSTSFVDQSTDIARGNNPKLTGGSSGPTSRRSRIANSENVKRIKEENENEKKRAQQAVALERAKKGAATTSDLVTQGADFNDIVRNYSLNSEENLLASQLNYNEDKLEGVEKGQFEQKAINQIGEDMFTIIDDTENSQVWKSHGGEYGFLINQLNSTTSEIRSLQQRIEKSEDPDEIATLSESIGDLLEEGAEFSMDKEGVGTHQFVYGSYKDMQDRFRKLNTLPEFKNYQRAVNILTKLRDVSEDFDNRNPEFVANQEELKKTQEFIDNQDRYDLPTFTAQGPMSNSMVDNISKPILGALAKGLRDIATLPRTLAFNDEYGWTDAFADWTDRNLNPEYSANTLAATGISSRRDRGFSEKVARVDGYQVVVTDDLGGRTPKAKTVRDSEGFLITDPAEVRGVIEKYEANPDQYQAEQQYNSDSFLPTFTGVLADLGILMFGTKGIGAGVKGTGKLASGTKVGNYLTKGQVANRIGLTGAVTGQTHNGLYEEAIRNGLSPSEASAFAITGSLVVAGVAQFNPQFYLLGEKKAAQQLTKRYVEYLAKGETKKQAFKFALKEVGFQGVREMTEELVEVPALNATRYLGNSFLTPDKKFEIEWSRGEIEQSAIFGLAAGLSTGPMNITSQSALQQEATYAAYKAKDKFFKRTDDLIGQQYVDPESGDVLYYSKEQAEVVKTGFNDLFRQLDATKKFTNELSEESEVKLLSLYQNSNAIKDLMDDTKNNPALLKQLQDQYSQVQDAIAAEIELNKKPTEPVAETPVTETPEETTEPVAETPQQVEEDVEFDKSFEDILGARPVENVAPESEPKPKTEGDQTNEFGTIVEPGVVRFDTAKQFRAFEGALNSKKTDAEMEKLGFKKDSFLDKGNNIQRTFKNIKIDLSNAPVFDQVNKNGKRTGKKYHKLFDYSTTEAYYVPVGEEIYIDNNGITRPSDTEGNVMGGGIYMSNNMFVPADPESTQTSSKPKPLFTKEEVSTAKANNDYLTPLVQKLKENFPGVDVVVDENAIVELAKNQNVSDQAAKGAKGVFDVQNNRVIINPKTATKDTPIHEFGHVWNRIAQTQRPELYKRGLELIKGSKIEQELRERVKNDPDQAKVYTEDKILDEALAIAIGRRGAKIYEDSQQQSKWDKFVEDFFNFIAEKFGVDPNQAIADLSLREFVELASAEIITGETVAPIEVAPEPEVKTDEAGQTLLFQANYVDPETGIEFTYDKNGDAFAKLVEDGFIDKSKKLSDFAGTNMILHSPDFAFSGQISKDGNVLIEGKGGMYYPIKFHDKGFFWASTSGAANSMVNLLNDALASSPDGKVRMALTTAPPTKVMSSTTAANGVVDLFTSDSFVKTLGLTEQRVKRSLVIAANQSNKIRVRVENPKTGEVDFKLKDVGLGMNLSNKMSLEEIKSEIRKKLGADNSTFNDRKLFTDEVFRSVSKKLNNQNVNISKKLANFFKRQFPSMKATGGKVSMSNLRSAVSYMIGEPLLRNETESGKVYAILEAEGQVEAVKSNDHESYPVAIKMANPDSKVTLNILTDRKTWSENFEIDNQVNEDGSPKTLKQIYPSYGVTTTSLKVKGDPMFQMDGRNPVTEEQVNQVLQRSKEMGVDKAKIVNYLNRRFPNFTTEKLSELYEGNIQPKKDEPTAERKYTSRLTQVLSGETTEALSENAKKYVPRSNQITDAEAQILLDELGLEESVNVIKQNPDYLIPEVRIALTNKVIIALEEQVQKLRDEGKVSEAETISAGINSIVEQMSREGTNSGRFIQAFKMLNALSADRTISLINKRLEQGGKPPLTEEEKSKLKDLIKQEKAAEEGLPKSKALAELYKYKMSITGATIKDLFEAYFYASILSGLTTQQRNIFANLMSIGSELMVTSIREVMKGNLAAPFLATQGLIKGFAKGWVNAKNILTTGVRSARSDKFDSPQLLEWWRFNSNNKVLNKIANAPWYTFVSFSPNVLKYVNRGMVAFDQMFFHAAKDMQAFALASRIKAGKTATPEDIKKANDILNPPGEYIQEAETKAEAEGFEPGSTEFKIRVHELVEAKRDLTIQGTAETFGSKTTFNYDPEGGLSYLYDAVVQMRNAPGLIGPTMTTFIPFARVLTNVFNRFLHYTPIGFVTATTDSSTKYGLPFSGLGFKTHYNGKKWSLRNFRLGNIKNEASVRVTGNKYRALTTDEKADLTIKATIGSSVLASLVIYLNKGLDDDEEQMLKITASGPTDFRKKYELQKGGWKPYTITYGDVSVSYKDHPLFFILAAAGTLYESNKYGNELDEDLTLYVAGQTAVSMTGQSWLQGIDDLGGLLSADDFGRKSLEKIFGTASSVFVPNFHKQAMRLYMEIMDDPIKARAEGILPGAVSKLYRDIPMINSGLYDLVDTMGDPVMPNQSEKYIPFEFAIGEDADPVAKILVDNGVFINFPSKMKKIKERTGERDMTTDEYAVYKIRAAELTGQDLRRALPRLKSLDQANRTELIQDLVADIKKNARQRAFNDVFYRGGYEKYKK